MDESGTESAECYRKEASAGAIRSLANARGLQFECARVLHYELLVPVLLYGSETMKWREKKRSRIKHVQTENLRGLLGIRRMDRVLNVWIRELHLVTKGVNEMIDELVL